MILAGDIGGTHTRLAFFEKGAMVKEPEIFPSQEFDSLEKILTQYLKGNKVEKACFGVAGPIQGGKVKVTNLSWTIEEKTISQTLSIPSVHLLNDLESNAYGIEVLKPEDFFLLNPGEKQDGNQALISAGTGLGQAGLFWDGSKHRPFATEGGHVSFAPRNEVEIELFRFLQKEFGHVSNERVLSGPGLHNIYRFLIDTKKEKGSPDIAELMQKKEAPKIISEWGSKGKDKACKAALHLFLSIYGAVAGDLALEFLALGGVFVGGGIAPQLINAIREGEFLHSFTAKGRFQGLLEKVSVSIILNDQTALLGAANYAENYQ